MERQTPIVKERSRHTIGVRGEECTRDEPGVVAWEILRRDEAAIFDRRQRHQREGAIVGEWCLAGP